MDSICNIPPMLNKLEVDGAPTGIIMPINTYSGLLGRTSADIIFITNYMIIFPILRLS